MTVGAIDVVVYGVGEDVISGGDHGSDETGFCVGVLASSAGVGVGGTLDVFCVGALVISVGVGVGGAFGASVGLGVGGACMVAAVGKGKSTVWPVNSSADELLTANSRRHLRLSLPSPRTRVRSVASARWAGANVGGDAVAPMDLSDGDDGVGAVARGPRPRGA